MAITIRRVQSSDKSDIMEISRHIWEGNDYLPSVLGQWLQDPNSHFFGAEVDGHVVAVGNLRLVEGGRTGWMEGLRVHPDHRGKGLANKITLSLVREAKHLGVQRLRYTTSSRNTASLKLAKMAGFSRVMKMAVLWHVKPKPIPTKKDYPPIQTRSAKRVCSLLETNPRIIPLGILIYEWKVLDSTCQNLEDIGKTHTFYVAFKGKRVDSLSFGYVRKEPDQSRWVFTIYAADSTGFLSQLAHNVRMASKHGISSIACTFEPRFEKTLKRVDLGSEDHHETYLVLLEKRIRLRKQKGHKDT